jgi:cholestenol delta-isomerase
MGGQLDLFGQLWKEYSLSDSRYLTRDAFVVCMETITAAFWGPLAFFSAYAVVAEHPARHAAQLVLSLGQLYGDVLYYATCTFEDIVRNMVYCRPEAFYFWAYYFLCNAFWIVIPTCLMAGSVLEITRVFRRAQEVQRAQAGTRKRI